MITRALALAAFLVSQVTEGGAMITEHNVGAHDLDAGKLYGDFSADPNTYLWRSAADEWTVVSGGVNVLVCDALGCSVVGNLNLNGNDLLNLDDAYSAASASAAVAARVTTIGTQGPINQAARPAQDDGANLVLAPASAWKGITGVTRAAVSEGATVTLTIQAEGVVSTCVKTEGDGAGGTFECNGAASDDACVTNLKATYTATPCVGVTVSAVAGETMGFTNTPGTASRIALAVSDTDIAISSGTDGSVMAPAGSTTAPSIAFPGGAYINATSTNSVTISSSNKIILDSSVSTNSNISIAAASPLGWLARAALTSPADGHVIIRNAGDTAGFRLNGTTDSTLALETRAGANTAILKSAGLVTTTLEANLTAGACTAGTWTVDTGGAAREMCRCNDAGSAYDCTTITTAAGPLD